MTPHECTQSYQVNSWGLRSVSSGRIILANKSGQTVGQDYYP